MYQGQRSYAVCLIAQLCLTLCDPQDCSLPSSSAHGDSTGKNTRVGCHALPLGDLPTQGLNPSLPHCRWILYHLSHQGSPWILEWVAYPFSRGLSRPRNRTGVSCIAGGFFTSWATREGSYKQSKFYPQVNYSLVWFQWLKLNYNQASNQSVWKSASGLKARALHFTCAWFPSRDGKEWLPPFPSTLTSADVSTPSLALEHTGTQH